MRVAFDVGPVRSQPTGVSVFASCMANALATELLADQFVMIGRRAGGVGLPEQTLSTPLTGSYMWWLQTNAARDIRRSRADVAHFSDGSVPFVRSGRTVVSIHDLSIVESWRFHPARRLLRVPFALAAPRLADLVIVPSRATADEVMRLTGTHANKIEMMPYGPQRTLEPADKLSIESTLALYGLAQGGYVLALGTIEPRKNHHRLVEAFEAAARAGGIPSDVVLVIAGQPGWHAGPILRRIDASPLNGRVRRIGYVPSTHVGPLLSAAAAVAYPSLYEGFGLPVVEAMACGAPTVTSNLSSLPEVAGSAGFLVDPHDVSDIARGLADAIQAGRTDRVRVAERARAQAATFGWQRAATTAVDLYRKLCT